MDRERVRRVARGVDPQHPRDLRDVLYKRLLIRAHKEDFTSLINKRCPHPAKNPFETLCAYATIIIFTFVLYCFVFYCIALCCIVCLIAWHCMVLYSIPMHLVALSYINFLPKVPLPIRQGPERQSSGGLPGTAVD